MHKISISRGRLVPWTFRLVGTLITFIVVVQLLIHLPELIAIPAAILISLLLPALWFSYDMITIDHDAKKITEGYWVMGKLFGKPLAYENIEKFFVNQVKTSQQMYSQTNKGYTSRNTEYKIFVKTTAGNKYFILSQPSEKLADEKVDEIKGKLGIA